MESSGELNSVVLDRRSPVPLHYQFQLGIISAIEEGALKPGQRLPSILAYAKSCDISPATVAQAFAQLAREGFVVTHRGRGTLVAGPKIKTTEVLIQSAFSKQPPDKSSFFYQIAEGLQNGYGDPARRFIFTQYHNPPQSARELLDVCRTRGSDGMVVYRPIGELAETVGAASRNIPAVTLFYPIIGSLADCVLADPAAPLAELMDARLSRGMSNFIYIGFRRLIEEDAPLSPYNLILNTFRNHLEKAGITPDIRLSDATDHRLDSEECARLAGGLPDDAVVVAGAPEFVDAARLAGCQSQMITYTESAQSLERIKGKADVLYMGLEIMSVSAAELLKARAVDKFLPQRRIQAQPVIDRATDDSSLIGSAGGAYYP